MSVQLGSEVACIDHHVSLTAFIAESGCLWSGVAAVGTWDLHLHVLDLRTLAPIAKEPIGGEIIPR